MRSADRCGRPAVTACCVRDSTRTVIISEHVRSACRFSPDATASRARSTVKVKVQPSHRYMACWGKAERHASVSIVEASFSAAAVCVRRPDFVATSRCASHSASGA